jgi:Ca2+/H+ antiporter
MVYPLCSPPVLTCLPVASLSYLTEQVAEHTNGTIGALLNATFGNAPELLISIAALRSGFYRVVQLAMLGSILTNMMLVFGVACLIGGARWQVQVLRLTSGNVSVVMLLVSTAGFLFPAALLLSGQFNNSYGPHDRPSDLEKYVPTQVEISFGRVNAAVMMILYVLFLVFTLGTHHEEFDSETLKDHSERRAQRNLFCLRHFHRARETFQRPRSGVARDAVVPGLELLPLSGDLLRRGAQPKAKTSAAGQDDDSLSSDDEDASGSNPNRVWGAGNRSSAAGTDPGSRSLQKRTSSSVNGHSDRSTGETVEEGLSRASFNSDAATAVRRNGAARPSSSSSGLSPQPSTIEILTPPPSPVTSLRMKNYTDHLLGSASPIPLPLDDPAMDVSSHHRQPTLSMRAGIFWLFVLTLCISALSDILVDTIDGFAQRMNLSQVFTSMVVVPFFSNVAEQVSAFLFAYRNEMDLVVGVTIGSAIQIASFVLPGSVLIGMVMDRSMTLYFRAYETVCMLFGVIVVGAVLQGGTTNWLVGAGTCNR